MSTHPRAWVSARAARAVLDVSATTLRDRASDGRTKRRAAQGKNDRFAYWPWPSPADPSAPTDLAWVPGEVAAQQEAAADGVRDSRIADVDVPQPVAANDDEDADPFGLDAVPSEFDEPTVEIKVPRKFVEANANRPMSIAWISDVHVPEHDVPAVNAWLQWVRDVQPDEIMLGGDIAEMASCSEHGGVANPAALMDDIKALRSFCEDVRAAAPYSRITFLEGNHCTRLKRVVVHKLPTFDGAIDIPTLCDLPGLGIDWVPFGKLVQRGKLRFVHGVYCNEHHAANHLRRFGCSIVYGHTHRAQTFTRATADMEMQAAFGMASMRTLDPEWTAGGPTGWGHGFGMFYVLPDGAYSGYQVFVTRGRFVWGGKLYDGNAA